MFFRGKLFYNLNCSYRKSLILLAFTIFCVFYTVFLGSERCFILNRNALKIQYIVFTSFFFWLLYLK